MRGAAATTFSHVVLAQRGSMLSVLRQNSLFSMGSPLREDDVCASRGVVAGNDRKSFPLLAGTTVTCARTVAKNDGCDTFSTYFNNVGMD